MHAPQILPLDPPCPLPARSASAFPMGERVLIEYLRDLARGVQLSAPMGLEQTCSLVDPGSARAFGMALMRALDAVATQPMAFHPRGAREASFDELWLVRLVRCIEADDTDSVRLLIGRRVSRMGRRTVTWLARGFAERLDEICLDGSSLEAF